MRVPVFAERSRSEEHTSELQSRRDLVCRLLLEQKKWYSPLANTSSIYRATSRYLRVTSSAERQPVRQRILASCCRTAALRRSVFFFFFNDTATTEIYTLSLHDALPI